MAYHQLRIAKIVQETADAQSFVLEVPEDLADRFRYRAGQFLTFRVPHEQGVFNRCYSLSSAPETDGRHLKVTVKRVPGGKGSNWFNDALKEGTSLHVLPPAGRFVLKEGDAPLLLFGGGSGITPMMSLIKSALRASNGRVKSHPRLRLEPRPSRIARAFEAAFRQHRHRAVEIFIVHPHVRQRFIG
jgi:3-ketosteroid 9alpha-monooxygenase subunit B